MLGSEKNPGIMYLTMVELYKRIEARKEEKSCEVLVSYQEVRCRRAMSPPASGSLLLRFGVDLEPVVPRSRLPAVPSVTRAALEPDWKQAHPSSLVNWCCWFPPSGVGEFSLPCHGPRRDEGFLAERALEERWHGVLPVKPSQAVLCV